MLDLDIFCSFIVEFGIQYQPQTRMTKKRSKQKTEKAIKKYRASIDKLEMWWHQQCEYTWLEFNCHVPQIKVTFLEKVISIWMVNLHNENENQWWWDTVYVYICWDLLIIQFNDLFHRLYQWIYLHIVCHPSSFFSSLPVCVFHPFGSVCIVQVTVCSMKWFECDNMSCVFVWAA